MDAEDCEAGSLVLKVESVSVLKTIALLCLGERSRTTEVCAYTLRVTKNGFYFPTAIVKAKTPVVTLGALAPENGGM